MSNGDAARMTKLVLLIDGENLPAKFADDVFEKANAFGTIITARVYGDFAKQAMTRWAKVSDERGLTRINVERTSRQKNAADFKLVVEAMDMLHTRQLDGFCLASSDGDFSALAERIRANALSLIGFGEKKAPESYRKLCDRFIFCEERPLSSSRQAHIKDASRAVPKRPATKDNKPLPRKELFAAIDSVKNEEGWAPLNKLGKEIRKSVPEFSSKAYGFSTLKRLIRSMPELEMRDEGGGWVRRKPA
jgi:hypothetical protein